MPGRFQRSSRHVHASQSPVPVTAPPGRFEVIEFFGYGCPHCNAFEPAFNP